MTEYKICTKCGEEKPKTSEYFNSQSKVKDGFRAHCKKCASVEKKKWYSKNRERSIKKEKEWRSNPDNRVKKYEKTRQWKAENKEHVSEYMKKWRENNQHRYRYYRRMYKSRKSNAIPPWADEELIQLIYDECPIGHQIDHIYPITSDKVCGLHTAENLQYLPSSINNSKNNKMPEDGNWSRY